MAILSVVIYLLFWSVVGFIAAKLLKIKSETFTQLHKFTFNYLLPAFVLLSITQHFNISFFLKNIGIAVAQIILILLALFNLVWFKKADRKYAFVMLAFQNSAYLPLPIILAMTNNNEVLLLLFMFLIGFNISIFTLGYWVLNRKSSLIKLLNPPLVATLIAIIISVLPYAFPALYPQTLQELIGKTYPLLHILRLVIRHTLIPLILFIFGGTLAISPLTKSVFGVDMHIKLAIIKFIQFPIIIFLLFSTGSKFVLTLLLIESVAPPAMNLILLSEKREDASKISNLLLIQYLIFIIGLVPAVLLWSIYS